jgi:hypothetical protein
MRMESLDSPILLLFLVTLSLFMADEHSSTMYHKETTHGYAMYKNLPRRRGVSQTRSKCAVTRGYVLNGRLDHINART